MKIYLDIDGVLLTKDHKPAEFHADFLNWCLANREVFWLTTHCKGDATVTVNKIKRFFPADTIPLLMRIKPTMWETLKTEGIELESDFLWFDDYIMMSEMDVLKKAGKLTSFVKVDLIHNPNWIGDYLKTLKEAI